MWKAVWVCATLALLISTPPAIAQSRVAYAAAATKNLAPAPDTFLNWFTGTLSIGTGGPGGAADFEYIGTGAPSGFRFPHSPKVLLHANQAYTFSMWCDASQTSGRAPFIGFYTPDVQTKLAFVEIPVGSASGRFSVSYTPPTDIEVVLLADTSNSVVASGKLLRFSRPKLELGSVATPYQAVPLTKPT